MCIRDRFLTIQDPGDTTTCRFYAYIKEDGEWKEEFKVAGYVGRSGIADAANRVEGDGTSPAGVYSFGMLFGIQDMSLIHIWCLRGASRPLTAIRRR